MDSKIGSPEDPATNVKSEHSGEMSTCQEQSPDGSFEAEGNQQADKRAEPRQPKPRNLARLQKRSSTEKKCKCCGTSNTPVWRWGGDAKDTLLCNACSLRIRRSNARPLRSKSPGERSQKRQLQLDRNVENHDSPPCANNIRPLNAEELDALRQKLAGFMTQEKARLLGANSDYEQFWSGPPVHAMEQFMAGQIRATHPFEVQPYPAEYPRHPHPAWQAEPQGPRFYQEGAYPGPLQDQELAHMFTSG